MEVWVIRVNRRGGEGGGLSVFSCPCPCIVYSYLGRNKKTNRELGL